MPLTEGDRSIVQLMISKAITEYDLKQTERHNANLQKFDEIKETISQVKNIRGLVAWGVPVAISVIMLIRDIINHIK